MPKFNRSRNLLKINDLSQMTKWVAYLGVFSFLASIDLLFQNSQIGQILIIVYGIFALISKIRSTENFQLSLVAFGVILIASIAGNTSLVQSFSIYVFLFLCIGILSTLIEQRKTSDRSVLQNDIETSQGSESGQKSFNRGQVTAAGNPNLVFINRRKH